MKMINDFSLNIITFSSIRFNKIKSTNLYTRPLASKF